MAKRVVDCDLDVLADLAVELELIFEESRKNEECCEECDNEDVNNGIFHDDPATLALLFCREQWRADLLRWAQPEEHRRVDGVEVGNQDGDRHDNQKNVPK